MYIDELFELNKCELGSADGYKYVITAYEDETTIEYSYFQAYMCNTCHYMEKPNIKTFTKQVMKEYVLKLYEEVRRKEYNNTYELGQTYILDNILEFIDNETYE